MNSLSQLGGLMAQILVKFGLGAIATLVLLLALSVVVVGCAPSTTKRLGLPPLETVEYVELERYMGVWYEISHFPQFFQRGCTATTATYGIREDGRVSVVNRCRRGGLDGSESVARGTARVVDSETNAKLSVTFFWPFAGDYWVIDLDTDYQYAVVGHPSRDYLWVLSRSPLMDDEVYGGILARLEAKGYQTDRLVRTLQVSAGEGLSE